MSDTLIEPLDQIEQMALETRSYHLNEFRDANEVAQKFTAEIAGLIAQAADACVRDQRILRSVEINWENIRNCDRNNPRYNPDNALGYWRIVCSRTKGFGHLEYHLPNLAAPTFIESPVPA